MQTFFKSMLVCVLATVMLSGLNRLRQAPRIP